MDLTADTPETIAWQQERVALADAALAELPAREGFVRSVAAHLADTHRHPLVRRGGRWFQRASVRDSDDQPVVVVRDAPTGAPRVLVDPNALSAERGTMVTLVDVSASPDGRMLAYAAAEAGTEQASLTVVDVETGTATPIDVPGNALGIVWLPDSTGFWFTTAEVREGALAFLLRQHLLDAPAPEPIAVPAGVISPAIVVSPDGRHTALRAGNTAQRFDWLIADGELVPFLRDVPGGCTGVLHGDALLAVVDDGAPRGRLVRIPIATAADASTWVELVAESDDVLRTVAVVGDVIVLGFLRDAAAQLRLLDLDGGPLGDIDIEPGSIGEHPVGASHPALAMFVFSDDEISFVHSTFRSSWATYRYVVSERRLEVVEPAHVAVDDLTVTTISATSSDGAEVLAHVVHRADLDRSQPQPTLLWGYGGFHVGYLPSLDAANTAWVRAGGIFVLSHLRGGGELGADWWLGGRREVKQRTFDDLYAVAERLVAEGWTTPERLAVKGESNGGLLTAAALVQRPELWAAVVSDVPVTDLLEYHRDPITYAIGREEYGDPLDPVEREWLRAVSPVHHVVDADYSPLLMTGGANDPRCPVWHIRVFVDAVERAQQGTARPLMRVYDGQGHGAAGVSDESARHADWLAFVAHHTGLHDEPSAVGAHAEAGHHG